MKRLQGGVEFIIVMKRYKGLENYVKYVKKLKKINVSFTHSNRNRNEKITKRQKIILVKLKNAE